MRRIGVVFVYFFISQDVAPFPGGLHGDGISQIVEETLFQLLNGPLRGDNVLLLMDAESDQVCDFDLVLNLGPQLSSALTAKMEVFHDGLYPSKFTLGALVTPVLVFLEDPLAFLQQLAGNRLWDPTSVVLVGLSTDLNMTEIIGHAAVQRSEFVFALQLIRKNGTAVFEASTSLPMNKNSLGQSLVKAPLDFWNPNKFHGRAAIFPPRFNNFEGNVLELATWCDDTPYLYQEDGKCTGANIEAFQMIATKFNFSFDIQMEPADLNWGSLENGTWVGMLADLERNGKHIAINYFMLNEDRARGFDFTYPYHTEGFAFLIRLPPPLPDWNRVFNPFSAGMWGAIIASTICVATLLALLLFHIQQLQDFVGVILKVIAGVLRQTIVVGPRPWWAKIWLCWWWLATIILSTAYTGNLIAFLTIPAFAKRPETVQELADSHIRVWICDYGNFVPNALRTSSDSALQKLAAKLDMDPYDNDHPYDSGFRRLREENHAVVETFSYLGYLQLQYNLSHISYIMKAQIYSGHLSWFLPLHTPYTSLISDALMRLREAGVIKKLIKDHFSTIAKLQRNIKEVRGGKELRLSHLQGAFLLWICGLAVALLTLFGEILASRCNRDQ